MLTILVAGSVNLDMSANVSRLPVPGETVTGATLAQFPGGKGGNQALAAQRLGAQVRLLAAVGQDAAAEIAVSLLRAGGVDLTHCVASPTEPTGVAMICVAPSGDNHIVVAPGANAHLAVNGAALPAVDALICQLEIPDPTIVELCASFAGFVCLNLAPARPVSPDLLQRANLVVVNETEAQWYGDELAMVGGLVATTYGAEGASLASKGTIIARSAAPTVEVVDTTGAGDTFTAALTIALLEGKPAAAALDFACHTASLATTRRGAQPSLPMRAEAEAFIGGAKKSVEMK
jgi:ribokinase